MSKSFRWVIFLIINIVLWLILPSSIRAQTLIINTVGIYFIGESIPISVSTMTVTPTPCPTSVTNGDCLVDAQDARSLIQEWLSRVANNLDFNQDSQVNALDFLSIFSQWNV